MRSVGEDATMSMCVGDGWCVAVCVRTWASVGSVMNSCGY